MKKRTCVDQGGGVGGTTRGMYNNGVPENLQFLGRSGAAPGTFAKHGLAGVPKGMPAKRSLKVFLKASENGGYLL